jgi:hypothetical protein
MYNFSAVTTTDARGSFCPPLLYWGLSSVILPEVAPSGPVQSPNPHDKTLCNLFDTNQVDNAAALILSNSASLQSSVMSVCGEIPSRELCPSRQVRIYTAAKRWNRQSIISSTKQCAWIAMETTSDSSTSAMIIN